MQLQQLNQHEEHFISRTFPVHPDHVIKWECAALRGSTEGAVHAGTLQTLPGTAMCKPHEIVCQMDSSPDMELCRTQLQGMIVVRGRNAHLYDEEYNCKEG